MSKRLYLFEIDADRFFELADGQPFGERYRVLIRDDHAWLEEFVSKKRRQLQHHELVELGDRRFILTDQNEHRPSLVSGHNDYTMIHGATKLVRLETRVDIGAEDDGATVVQIEKPTAPPIPHPIPQPISAPAPVATEKKSDPTTKKLGLAIAALAIGVVAYVYAPGGKSLIRQNATPQPAQETTQAAPVPKDTEAPWVSTPIEQLPGFIYLKNSSIIGAKPTFSTFSQDTEILARALALPRGEINVPFPVDPASESAADQACSNAPKPELVRVGSPIGIEPLISSIAAGDGELRDRIHDENAGPLPQAFLNARLSTIRFPIDHKIELASVLIDCRDPTGKRVALSQHRATVFHVMQAKLALQDKIRRHEREILSTVENKYSREANKGVHLSTQIKAMRNIAIQLSVYMNWLNSPAGRSALGGGVAAFARATASFGEHIRAQREELESKYAEGRFVYPAYYPEIPKEAFLTDSDLLFLSAY